MSGGPGHAPSREALPDDPRRPRYARGTEEFGRVLTFVDGVVAIALTLLILAVDVPPPAEGEAADADLWPVLDELTPQLFAFLLSFTIISIYWFNHHRFMSRLAAINGKMIAWTLVFLLTVVLMPLQAEIIGFYSGNEQAVALYAAGFVAIGLVSIAGYAVAVQQRLVREDHSRASVRAHVVDLVVAPAVFALSIPIALFVSPVAAMYSWLLIWPVSVVVGRTYTHAYGA
jgi:uncharacterized membrane protein